MDQTLTREDIEFLRWLDSEECEHYWEKDSDGEEVILREGRGKAQEEYKKLKNLADNKNIFYFEEKHF